MTQQAEHRSIDDAVELLKEHGFDALAEAVTVLLNASMLAEREAYLGAKPCERNERRVSHAKASRTRL